MTNTDTDEKFLGYTPEEMGLPTDLVARIRQVCALVGLPVAERSTGPGVVLCREDPWTPGEKADHVGIAWYLTDELMDAEEAGSLRARDLVGIGNDLEEVLAAVLRRGGLAVQQMETTYEWRVTGIVGPSPLG